MRLPFSVITALAFVFLSGCGEKDSSRESSLQKNSPTGFIGKWLHLGAPKAGVYFYDDHTGVLFSHENDSFKWKVEGEKIVCQFDEHDTEQAFFQKGPHLVSIEWGRNSTYERPARNSPRKDSPELVGKWPHIDNPDVGVYFYDDRTGVFFSSGAHVGFKWKEEGERVVCRLDEYDEERIFLRKGPHLVVKLHRKSFTYERSSSED